FLRERRAVVRAAVGPAQRFSRIGMRSQPCGSGPEERAGNQRHSERKTQDGEERRGGDGNERGAGEGERDEEFYAKKSDDEAGEAAEDREQDAFGEGLAN